MITCFIRVSVASSRNRKPSEIQADIAPMDLGRFLDPSLYGAIARSKTETTEHPMSLFLRLTFEPFALKR